MKRRSAIFWLLLAACCNAMSADDTMMMVLDAPIETWDEAIPLGNGLTGGLLWGKGNRVNLSLDRGDLWDERLPKVFSEEGWGFPNIRELVAVGNQKEINRRYDTPYREAAPTKLPGGRLVLTLPASFLAETFVLDMRRAVGSVVSADGRRLECFFHASESVTLIRVDAPKVAAEFLRPKGLDRLGYGPAAFGEDGGMKWMVQDAALGLKYAVVVAQRPVGAVTELAVAITANTDCADPLAEGKQRVERALAGGYAEALKSHERWWNAFSGNSSVTIPHERLQRHYNLVKYFYGAASRPDAPPMPLQGVWTRDDGGLPPWKGDYHHDLNTQMTYLPCHAAGLTNSGLSFINMCWDRLPFYREFARDFFGVDGAAIASVATLAGRPTGGWTQYSLTAPNGLWVGHSFYLHWRYTMDTVFLRERAYPWLSEIATGIVSLCEERDGRLYLLLSSSPEIHNNSLRAWLPANTNYDLSLMQWAFEALEEMALALGRDDEAKRWGRLRDKLEPLHADADNVLMFAKGEPFNQSHRHHSHTMAIHPLGRYHVEQGARERQVINATLDRMLARGTQAWTGYSFSWFAGVLARCGRAEQALDHLQKYEAAFTLRNGFHVNGDQLGIGLSGFRYRPFTLEGNFLAMDAVHEMLLQSWSPSPRQDPTPLIRIFPATPWSWHQVAFEDLHTEGGFIVSARRLNNETEWFRIEATVDGVLRIRDSFRSTPRFSRKDVRGRDGVYEVALRAGESLVAQFDVSDDVHSPPENVTRPFKLPGRIRPNRLPLRIGADSNGQNCFRGDMARASVFERELSAAEIASLAHEDGGDPVSVNGCVATWDFESGEGGAYVSRGSNRFRATVVGDVGAIDSGRGFGKAVSFSGNGYLNVSHHGALDCPDGLTLEAWVRPRELPKSGARIIDKSPAGAATAYLLDTYPGNSLRLIFRDPHLGRRDLLKEGEWIHVAATVDGLTGCCALYANGEKVAESR